MADGVQSKLQRKGTSLEMASLLGVSIDGLRQMTKRDICKSPKGRVWDFPSTCRQIRSNCSRGVAFENACGYLAKLDRENGRELVAKSPQSEKRGTNDDQNNGSRVHEAGSCQIVDAPGDAGRGVGQDKGMASVLQDAGRSVESNRHAERDTLRSATSETGIEGLEGAVQRLRAFEVKMHDRAVEALDSDDQRLADEFGRRFNQWKAAQEQLRKMEADLLGVLEERRELVRLSEVREWAVRNAFTVKGRFLQLPGMLAQKLDGAPWQKVQSVIDEEIRAVLESLSVEPEATK